ncbi:MAG: NADP oxidoreductase, partial [Gammaproteobacteria bacterium]
PAFDLDAALTQARRMTGRDDAGAHLGDNREALAEERSRPHGGTAAATVAPSPVTPAPTKDLQP